MRVWVRRRALAAGFGATVAMTAAMAAMFRLLPGAERYPLPPRFIAVRAARAVGLAQHLDDPARAAATLALHFGYGTSAGAACALVTPALRLPRLLRGLLAGLLVYVVGYMGWLPLTGLYRPPGEEPAARNALMVAAHLVWGGTLSLLAERGRG